MMIVHSQWRVKVAISVVFLLSFYLGYGQSVSKDSFHKKVTIKGQHIPVEEVLRQLSTQANLYFIYSSNSIALHKFLSLNIYQRPVQQVLTELGEMIGVTFRREGDYVVVKAIIEPKEPAIQEKSAPVAKQQPPPITAMLAPETNLMPTASSIKTIKEIDSGLLLRHDLLRRNLLYCTSGFTGIDTSIVKRNFPFAITNPRPKRILFTSFSLTVNEYSGGAEIRIGHPSIYAVINAGFMGDGYFRSGYGLGTSFRIKPMVTFNPIYTFATLKDEKDYVVDEALNLVMKDGVKIRGKHHQLKFLFQIQLSKRFNIHVGPAFNFLETSYAYQKATLILSDVVTSSLPSTSSGYYVRPGQGLLIRHSYYSPPADFQTAKTWIGFETGVSYTIKFPHRP